MTLDVNGSSRPTFNSRLKAIVEEHVSPVLSHSGFQKRKDVYQKELPNLAWIIDVQRSRWSDASEAQFTLNCGVFVPGVISTYTNRPERAQVDSVDCCIRTRIGLLSNQMRDKWWTLSKSDNFAIVDRENGAEVAKLLVECALPFLYRFETLDNVLRFLTIPRSPQDKSVWPQAVAVAYSYAAVIASKMNRANDVATALEMAMAASKGSPAEEFVIRLRERLTA